MVFFFFEIFSVFLRVLAIGIFLWFVFVVLNIIRRNIWPFGAYRSRPLTVSADYALPSFARFLFSRRFFFGRWQG